MSEEMKNLNEQQPEETKAPVEEKAEAPKLPLSKKTIAIIAGAVAAALVLVLVLVLVLGGGKDPHTHSFENGKCACGETDPNYVPPHTHSFVEGKCACGETDPNYVPPHTHSFVEGKCECGATDPNYVPEATNEYTLGMGLVFGDLTNTQINATIATVVLDSNGVIVAAKLDAVQNKFSCTADGVVFSNLLTKKELGNDYHMHDWGANQDRNGDGIVKEWFEQAAAFEAWCVGKTIAEVAAMETQTQADGYVIPADEALLAAGCTIQITDFVEAVVKAGNDDQAMTFTTEGEIVLGLGVNSFDDGSNGDDFEATVKMNIEFAAAATVDGVIVASLNDAIQPQIKVEDGSVISTSVGKGEGVLKTKRELGNDYHMHDWGASQDRNGDGKVLEWYLQSEAFSKHVVGMTAKQVYNMATQTQADGYVIPADEALLAAGCTIQITGIKAVVAEAAGYVPSAEKEYTLGMGLVFGDLTNAQINATIATVVLDENGVIVAIKLDAVQNKFSCTADGIVFSNLLTKKELGNDYHMHDWGAGQDRNGDGIVKEWFEQAAAFEAWCVGKTIAEVAAMETQTQADGYVIPADEALLAAGCTIQITDFVEAVVKAGNDDQAMTFTTEGEIVLGLGVNSFDDGSNGDDFEATVKMNIEFAAAATVDGVIVASLNDAIQPQVKVEDGSVISTSVGKGEGVLKTKRELGNDYHMHDWGASQDRNGDGKVLEWYLQSEAFSKHVVGMTAEEVYNMATQTQADGYVIPADEALLSAGCTIQITGIKAVVAEAAGYAA